MSESDDTVSALERENEEFRRELEARRMIEEDLRKQVHRHTREKVDLQIELTRLRRELEEERQQPRPETPAPETAMPNNIILETSVGVTPSRGAILITGTIATMQGGKRETTRTKKPSRDERRRVAVVAKSMLSLRKLPD
jgi:hypothetical protein